MTDEPAKTIHLKYLNLVEGKRRCRVCKPDSEKVVTLVGEFFFQNSLQDAQTPALALLAVMKGE